ncbi:MAG: hypothetical protein A2Y00_01780 [Omnitrophica WOR_2 bacterium GWF2_43_52]|nr:MAG: hypothetical protein A2Y01_02050 [Omnitrophica WOR_2 bacterium GWC2_44_8]OGX20084.1 MAG: hypothetical protein A2Y00_01780 [Omnitrophica WOR_2 bacterium GWF2_43_52]OGX58689.1 MAG: hypothetical protein A2460_07060 [Omnitrophica WOR_2 bacterium RIFOXYC2_FULL_43_9]HAH19694.1 hypothetical protein [Candidatus Omnitrophota bacterium]HBG64054.1 hypothetical protein [Candidatus Omnitrophota bacterium]
MASLTLSVPRELRQKMASFKYINWSEVAREAIIRKLEVLEKMDRLLSESTLSVEDTIKYGRMINKGIWKKHKSH